MLTKTKIYRQKQRSLGIFLAMLRQQGLLKGVDNIVLYGSTARGDMQSDSDIDVLLFARQPKHITDQVAEVSYETMLQTGDRIEVFVYPVNQMVNPTSYFLVRALQEGKVMKT